MRFFVFSVHLGVKYLIYTPLRCNRGLFTSVHSVHFVFYPFLRVLETISGVRLTFENSKNISILEAL